MRSVNGALLLVVAIGLIALAPSGHATPRARPAAPARAAGAAPAVRGPRPFVMIPPRGYRVVERPARVACALEADRFSSPVGFQVDFPLAAEPGGRTFAIIRDGAIRVLVPAGSLSTPYVVEFEQDGLFLRGHLGPSAHPERGAGKGALLVYPTRPVLLGGLYRPSPKEVLRLTRDARHGFVVAPIEALPSSLVLERDVLPATVPCDALSLERSRTAVAPVPPGAKARQVTLAAGATLPLLDRPGGRRLATIKVGPSDFVLLEVHPVQAGHVQVAWELRDGTVVGHVPARLLAPVIRPLDGGLGIGSGRYPYLSGLSRVGRSPDPALRCQDDVLLAIAFAPAPGARRPPVRVPERVPVRVIVGGFRAGTRIRTDGEDADSITVWPYDLPYTGSPAAGVRFYLPKLLLGACR